MTSEVWVDGFGNTVKTIVHGYDDAGRETSISDGRAFVALIGPEGMLWKDYIQKLNGLGITPIFK